MMEIEIPKIEFEVGDEKKFYDFIGNIDDKDKVALISHTDLDGIAVAKIANEVLDADVIRFVDYSDLNEDLIKGLKEEGVNKIFMSDLYVKYPEFVKGLEKSFERICIIDHHTIMDDWNSDKIVFLNSGNNNAYCATYLCYYLFSKIKDLEKWDWLATSASISDWTYFENKGWMKKVMEKYGDKYELLDDGLIRKDGKFWDLQWKINLAIIYFKDSGLRKVFDGISEQSIENLGEIGNYANEVEDHINSILERFEKERQEINGRLFFEFQPKFKIGSIISTITSTKYWGKTVIIARNEERTFNFSARNQDASENVDALLKRLTSGFEGSDGGGHVKASGGHVRIEDKEEFMRRLRELKEVVK